jgi:diaminopimelate decarboxylase
MILKDSSYQLGGVDLINLCDQFGTPLYVYDAETISSQYKKITSAFSGVNLKIKYACKALSNQAVLKLMKILGSGLDAVSIEEVLLGLKAGFSPSEILFTPNGVSFEEIKKGVEKKSCHQY